MARWIAVPLLVAVSAACASTRAPAPAPTETSVPAPTASLPEETPPPSEAAPEASSNEEVSIPRRLGREFVADFKWTVNSLEADGESIVKSPLHTGELLENPTFYWTTLAAGAALGGSFALDEPARRAFREISHKDAGHLETWGNVALWGSTGALYVYGLALDDARARRFALTSLESVSVSGLLTGALKTTFGRLRPNKNEGHWKWFQGGSSFVSGATTPAFALAALLSEYGDNRWYFALPAYTAAASVGLGRMGKDAHWLSDIMGSALLGVGTSELFLYLHASHEAEPDRYRIFPVVQKGGVGMAVSWDFWGP